MFSAQDAAVLSVLAFLGTAGLILLALVVLAWGLYRHDPVLTGRAATGGAVVLVTYLLLLTGFGVASSARVVEVGGEKYFCEVDCHLAYSVVGVRSLSRAAALPDQRLWAVTVRTRFDESTISRHRSLTAPTWPAPRRLELIDAVGRRYEPVEGPAAVGPDSASAPLTQELRPGESYRTTLLFELPVGAAPTRLWIQDDLLLTRILIGNERSPFHAPVLLAVPEPV
jgi:hypothetical protein